MANVVKLHGVVPLLSLLPGFSELGNFVCVYIITFKDKIHCEFILMLLTEIIATRFLFSVLF